MVIYYWDLRQRPFFCEKKELFDKMVRIDV